MGDFHRVIIFIVIIILLYALHQYQQQIIEITEKQVPNRFNFLTNKFTNNVKNTNNSKKQVPKPKYAQNNENLNLDNISKLSIDSIDSVNSLGSLDNINVEGIDNMYKNGATDEGLSDILSNNSLSDDSFFFQ